MISYLIPLTGIKVSTNRIYAGIHWTKRKKIKDSILDIAAVFFRPIQRILAYPVEIRYRFIFSSRALDTTNTTFLVKMFEDALRALEIIKDDSPQYVARTVIEVVVVPRTKNKKAPHDMGQKKVEKNEDWLEITIKTIKQNLCQI